MGTPSILIVEDDYIVAKVIEKSLLELNYRIAGIVGSAEEAVKAAEQEQPDLVLMDINLSGQMDGIEAAGNIHSIQKIPVVFLTASSDKNTFARALDTAPYGYILKPFQTNTLATTIQVALNKHRLERAQADRNQWLEGALQSLSEGIITIDTDGRITLMNPFAEQITGWTSAKAQGQPLSRVLRFTDPVTHKQGSIALAPVLRDGMVMAIPESHSLITNNGSRVPLHEVIVSPLRNSAGSISGAAIVVYLKEAVAAGTPAPSPFQEPFPKVTRIEDKTGLVSQRHLVTADDWNDRGNSLVFMRRYEDAARAYDRAIAINPTNFQAWYGKGTALAKIGQLRDAIAAYDKVLIIHPRNHQVMLAKGVLLKKMGKDSEADRYFDLARLYTP